VIERAAKDCQELTYDSSVHPPQLSDVSTDDITWTGEGYQRLLNGDEDERLHDTTDQLDHTVGNTAESPDGEDLQQYVILGVQVKGAA